jgi:hypothetical protein
MRLAGRIFFAALFVSSAVTATRAQAPENDWKIVASERVGPITSGTRHTDLQRLFPNAAVKYVFEALTANHLTTITGDDGLQITIYWTEKGGTIRAIHVRDPQSKWRTESGLKSGMSLGRVEEINDGSFLISNFHAENEESGATTNWVDGRLPAGLQAVFTPSGEPTQRLVDGTHFRSSDRGLRRIGLRLTGYIVKLKNRSSE